MEAAGQALALNTAYHQDAVARFRNKQPLSFGWETSASKPAAK